MHSVPDLGSIRFRSVRDAGSALNATFAFLRENARELATSYLALVVPVLLASAISTVLWMSQVGDSLFNPSPDEPFAIFNWTYAGSVLFGMLGSTLMQASASAYVRLYREGEAGHITMGVLWDEAKTLILPYIGMALLFFAVIFLTGVINIIPCLGAIAWVAFIVWVTPIYTVAIAARALEAGSVVDAWTRARALVKDSWGFTAGTMFLAFMVLFVIYFAVSMVAGGLTAAMGANMIDPSQSGFAMGIVFAPVQVVAGAIYLVPLVAAFFVHGRLVEDLEGTTLTDDLDALATGFDVPRSTPPASTPPVPPSRTDSDDDEDGPPSSGFRGGGFG
ncbi:hypothetical protein [Rubrivirga sp.]|uniref:hypothetical protein n=1 Tax=Rubrivirga sp. TaxID=1885344 RepID=UPI003C766C05